MKSIDVKNLEGDEEEQEAGALLSGKKWSAKGFMKASFAWKKKKKFN